MAAGTEAFAGRAVRCAVQDGSTWGRVGADSPFGLAMDRVLSGAVSLAATGAVFHALQSGGDSLAAAIAGSAWFPVALCALGALLTWAFVRDTEPPGPDPAVAGDPPVAELRHHRHHRRFHL